VFEEMRSNSVGIDGGMPVARSVVSPHHHHHRRRRHHDMRGSLRHAIPRWQINGTDARPSCCDVAASPIKQQQQLAFIKCNMRDTGARQDKSPSWLNPIDLLLCPSQHSLPIINGKNATGRGFELSLLTHSLSEIETSRKQIVVETNDDNRPLERK